MLENIFNKLPYGITPTQAKIGLAVLAAALLYYWIVMRPSLPYAYYLLAETNYGGLDAEFVRAWAKGHQSDSTTFTYAGKVYITKTGKAQ